MMKKYSAAIIGCGNVAGMYGDMSNKSIQCHAQAYQQNVRTDLKAVHDPDIDCLERFCEKWDVEKGYLSLEEMTEVECPEIISICSPTKEHFQHFEFLTRLPIKGIFAEKPLSNYLDEAKQIVEMTKDMVVAVNYFRRWNKELQLLKKDIDNNVYGEVQKVIIHHTKGIKNNGSHLIDFLIWFFGNVRLKKVINKYEQIDNDIGVDCLLTSSSGIPIILSHVPNVDYVYIEIELICNNAVVKINQRGQAISLFIKEQDPDYRVFNRVAVQEEINTKWNDCFENAISNIISSIENDEKVLCTPKDALDSIILCENILLY